MNHPELILLLINFVLIFTNYLLVLPRVNYHKGKNIFLCDSICFCIASAIAALLFWNSNTVFSLIVFEMNWFWFTTNTYLLIATAFMIWFCHKHNLSLEKLFAFTIDKEANEAGFKLSKKNEFLLYTASIWAGILLFIINNDIFDLGIILTVGFLGTGFLALLLLTQKSK